MQMRARTLAEILLDGTHSPRTRKIRVSVVKFIGYAVAIISRHRGIVCRNLLIISLLSPPAIFPDYSITKSQADSRTRRSLHLCRFSRNDEICKEEYFPRSRGYLAVSCLEKGRRSANRTSSSFDRPEFFSFFFPFLFLSEKVRRI